MPDNDNYYDDILNVLKVFQEENERIQKQVLELQEENRRSREMLDSLKADLSEEKLKAEITDALKPIMNKLTEEINEEIENKLDEKNSGNYIGRHEKMNGIRSIKKLSTG